MKYNIIALLCLFLFSVSCSGDKKKEEEYYRGELHIQADESFADVIVALGEGYSINYPEAKIQVTSVKEDEAFNNFIQRKTDVIALANELSPEQKKEMKRLLDIDFQPAKFSADAVLFVVPANDPRTEITEEEISQGLLNNEKKFIFTGYNTANLKFIASKLGKQPKDLQFETIPGTDVLIESLAKYPGKIGVISQNAVSRIYNPKTQYLLSKIKILPVRKNGNLITPENKNLVNLAYPYTKILYFLEREPGFGIAKGFIRFACTQKGQIIVEKEGLQPFNIYPRIVKFNDQ